MIFSGPLTEEGEIVILFELLEKPITDFHEAVKYWKKFAEKIDKMLKVGNIQVTDKEGNKDLVYYFSKKLLVTTDDISKDLLSIKEWMLGKKRSCWEAIRNIGNSSYYEELDFQLAPYPKNVFIAWVLKNPEMVIKYVFNIVLIAVLVVLSPEFLSRILSYLSG